MTKAKRRKPLKDDDVKFLQELNDMAYRWFPFDYNQNYFESMQDLIDSWPTKSFAKTKSGKEAYGSIPSEIEGEKLAGSVLIDLGITDAITDKHRTYTPNFVVPVK